MSNGIIPFLPLGEIEAKERLSQFVSHYRPLAKILPNVKNFEENNWDLRGVYFGASYGDQKIAVRFTKLNEKNQRKACDPFPQPLLDFVKAYVLHLITTRSWESHAYLSSYVVPTLRYVELGLITAYPFINPCITILDAEILETINASIRASGRSNSSISALCRFLNQMVKDLQSLGLLKKQFSWTGVTPTYEQLRHRLGPKGDRARKAMQPSLEAMGAMVHGFVHAEGSREQWASAINGLLSGQPARFGECWFHRENGGLVDLEVQGQKRIGLRWWPEKKAKPKVKEFLADDPFVEVFRQSLRWLTVISAPAREIARWYEQNPGRLCLPAELEHLREKEILTVAEAASIRGVGEQVFLNASSWAKRKGIELCLNTATGGAGIRFRDLEKAVISDLPYGFPWFHRASNLKYSEMLILIREHEFHAVLPPSNSMFKVPNSSTYYSALDALVDRHELVEKDGTAVRVRSHQFRHWNETIEYKAGVDRMWANRHAGRARASQEESYDDRSDGEKLAQTSIVSVHRSILGDLILEEPNRPMTYAEIMAEVERAKRTGYALVTDKGYCCHDFTEKPCSEFRDCMFCDDHRCIKGIPVWDGNIRAAAAIEEENLANAMDAEKKGLIGVKEHVEICLLPRVTFYRQALEILNSRGNSSGTVFRHAPKAEPYDPTINAIRHRVELQESKGEDVGWLKIGLERLQKIHQVPISGLPSLSSGGQE